VPCGAGSLSEALLQDAAVRSAVAGGLALAFGGAPLGVLLIARRVSLIGDALSHALLPGIAIAYLMVGNDPAALTAGALIAALVVAGLSTLLARTRALPEDASLAVFYLTALALGVAVIGRYADAEAIHALLFGTPGALDRGGLLLAAGAATATLVSLALFVRGFVAETADPTFMRAAGVRGGWLHLLLMALVALNLVAGFRAFGALMTVGQMIIPAAAARFWGRSYGVQAGLAVAMSGAACIAGVLIAETFTLEAGAMMTLVAAALFVVSAIAGTHNGLLRNLPGRGHLEG
jgi:zinc/manganese transport system permease protein